jgi:type II secretory pathway pseudopilin PulG
MTRKSARSGLTLIEIVAILGILLFLFAMLAPMFFRVRETAGRTRSLNNLKQICLGVHNYQSTFNVMPVVIGPGQDGTRGTIFFHLLPYLEQDQLQRKGSVWQSGAIGTPLPLFLDDRDQSAPARHLFEGWLATSNYAASWPVFKVSAHLVRAMPDGTSNTIVFTERYQVCDNTPCVWGYDQYYPWAPMFGYTTRAKFQTMPAPGDCNPALPQSLEKIGILVGMGDGSCRLVAESISPLTWNLAVTPDDGQALPADWND